MNAGAGTSTPPIREMILKSSRGLSVFAVCTARIKSFPNDRQLSGKSLTRSAPARSCGGIKLDKFAA
jgi:hypothetical protein